MIFLPSTIDRPISPSNRRSQLLSTRTSRRQTSPNSLFPSIVIVHSTAIVASPNKATVMNCSGVTIRAQPQRSYRSQCFGDDLSGEQNVLELVRRFFPIDTLSADFFAGRSLASDIERHMISNFGDWTVEYLFEKIGAFSCSRDRFSRVIEAALHPLGRRGPPQAALAEHLNAVFGVMATSSSSRVRSPVIRSIG